MTRNADALAISLTDVESAMRLIQGQVLRTPVRHSQTLSALTGADIWLKLENQQFTASFKERGALTRLLALDAGERARGVICMSAGNHAQAVAYHAKRLGIPATIVMPRSTPNAKVEATRVFAPEIILHGSVFDEAIDFTHGLAEEKALTLVHPYDDRRGDRRAGDLRPRDARGCPADGRGGGAHRRRRVDQRNRDGVRRTCARRGDHRRRGRAVRRRLSHAPR